MTTQSTVLKDATPANTITLDNTNGVFSVKKGEGSTTTIASISSAGLTAPVASSNVVGTTTNDNAAAGYVGEYVESVVAAGSAVSLTTTTAKTITSISLTAGDWDVFGVVSDSFAGAATAVFGGASLTNNVLPAAGEYFGIFAALTSGSGFVQAIPTVRMSFASTTTVYLVTQATFTSTATAYGRISARRVR